MFKFFARSAKKGITLNLFMKSGNVISIDSVLDWQIKTNLGGEVCYVSINQVKDNRKQHLVMSSLQLSQIEAITETF